MTRRDCTKTSRSSGTARRRWCVFEVHKNRLGAHVLGVHIDAGLRVVHQIPSGMIGIVVHDKVIARAIPAPVGRERPVK
jgi:hypothetical protein